MPFGNKENEDPNSPPYPAKTTRSGAPFTGSGALKKKKGGGFRVENLLPEGEVVPVSDRDDLRLKSAVYQKVPGYVTPSKTKPGVTDNGSPYLQKGSDIFKSLGRVTVVKQGEQTQTDFFQVPGTSKRREELYPPVVNKQPEEVLKTLVPPDSDRKHAKRRITEKDIRCGPIKPRRSAKQTMDYTSANEAVHSQFPDRPRRVRYAWAHMDQLGTGGADIKRQMVAVPEGFNLQDSGMSEGPATSAVLSSRTNVSALDFESEIDLFKDEEGKSTHIGGKWKWSLWASPNGTRSVKIELDPQNTEFPTKALSTMVKRTFEEAFSSDGSSDVPSKVGSEEDEVEEDSSSFLFTLD